MVFDIRKPGSFSQGRKKGNVLFNDALNTFYLWLYGVGSVREETRCCHYKGYSFFINSNGIFNICTDIHDNTYHSLCHTSGGPLAGMRNSLIGPP